MSVRRAWLLLAVFAARRAGDYIVRAHHEPTDEQIQAYADSYSGEATEWAETSFVAGAETWPEWTKTGSVTTTAVSRWAARP